MRTVQEKAGGTSSRQSVDSSPLQIARSRKNALFYSHKREAAPEGTATPVKAEHRCAVVEAASNTVSSSRSHSFLRSRNSNTTATSSRIKSSASSSSQRNSSDHDDSPPAMSTCSSSSGSSFDKAQKKASLSIHSTKTYSSPRADEEGQQDQHIRPASTGQSAAVACIEKKLLEHHKQQEAVLKRVECRAAPVAAHGPSAETTTRFAQKKQQHQLSAQPAEVFSAAPTAVQEESGLTVDEKSSTNKQQQARLHTGISQQQRPDYKQQQQEKQKQQQTPWQHKPQQQATSNSEDLENERNSIISATALQSQQQPTLLEQQQTQQEERLKRKQQQSQQQREHQHQEESRPKDIQQPAQSPEHHQTSQQLKKRQQQEEQSKSECRQGEQVQRRNRYILEPLPQVPPEASISGHDVQLLHEASHEDPFGVLGPHEVVIPRFEDQKCIVVRAWVRNVESMKITCWKERSDCLLEEEPLLMEKRADFLFEKAFAVYHLKESEIATAATPETSNTEDQPQSKQKGEEVTRERGPPVKFTDASVNFKYRLLCVYSGDSSNMEHLTYDIYSFGLLLPHYDLELFQSGSCWHVDDLLGAHIVEEEGVKGVRFAVWAPNACTVSVVCDSNSWDPRGAPMRLRSEFAVFELFYPHLSYKEKYAFFIRNRHTRHGEVKIDPYAQEFEVPPQTASVISACDDAFKPIQERFKWSDDEWMQRRIDLGKKDLLRRQPMAIYEVHLPSWMRGDHNTYLSYRELAERLVRHMKNLNFTHVEFLPLAHHPFEGSWGYQVTGQYAPYSRLGNADDFKFLVNELHRHNIGVFLDFVPAHFCKDAWALARYDGQPCYEYADPREGEHKLWGTLVFNFRRNEVRSFLLGAAYHWLRRYHIDGLRIDAVSSMLYKNHQRPAGEWLPNECGGDANLQAISLLKELNWVIKQQFPGVFTMAEESTSWRGVTDQTSGLGFDAKWDLGWMNDTLSYLCLPLYKRSEPACHNKLTFRGLYMAHERWILPLSHDEVVNGKGSLLDKCGFKGSPFEDRVKTMRSLFGFQVGSPGRPLIFMGAEIAQGREWKRDRSVDWHEGEEELRKKLCLWLSDLLAVYVHHVALHAGDDEPWNFKWTDCDNNKDSVIAFLRSYEKWYNDILVICNFSPNVYYRYPVGVPHGGDWEVLLNSDDWRYAGSMIGPGNLTRVHTTQGGRLGWPYCLWLDLPPFGCLYLKSPQPPPAQQKQQQQQLKLTKTEKDGAAFTKASDHETVQQTTSENSLQQQQQLGRKELKPSIAEADDVGDARFGGGGEAAMLKYSSDISNCANVLKDLPFEKSFGEPLGPAEASRRC